MPQSVTFRSSKPKVRAAAVAIVVIASIAAFGPGALAQHRAGKPSKRVVAEAENPTLGKTVLTTIGGRTLYSLSAEKNGAFICKTRACLADWHPLIVPPGVRPTGPVKLGTIVRPGSGRHQVIYRGRPLYSFDEDEKAGDVNGEGFKDVGTWHAATPQAQAQPTPQPPNPYSGH